MRRNFVYRSAGLALDRFHDFLSAVFQVVRRDDVEAGVADDFLAFLDIKVKASAQNTMLHQEKMFAQQLNNYHKSK